MAKHSKLIIVEGSYVSAPITEGGTAIGIIARKFKGGFLLCYFFVVSSTVSPSDYQEDPALFNLKTAGEADLICICSDMGIVTGTWRIHEHLPNWRRESWPVPLFGGEYPALSGRMWLFEYNDEEGMFVPISRSDFEHASTAPDASICGSVAVERRLARIVGRKLPPIKPLATACAVKRAAEHVISFHSDSKGSGPSPGILALLLKGLLDALDAVAVNHEEVTDTEVRDHIRAAVHGGFIEPKAAFKLPRKFGMFTSAGDRAVRAALQSFLAAPDLKRAAEELPTAQARLDAFQDITVQSANGSTYDDYFGEAASV